jgi:RNA polymerase sigma-70 factor (ECF subfamily)
VHDQTDQVLLRAMRRGDEAAARALLSRIGPGLTVFARGLLRDEALAEDALQNAMCKVMRCSTREIEAVESPRAWLAKIVRREALTMIRANRRAHERNIRRATSAAAASLRDPHPADAFDDGNLSAAVALLPRRLGEIIILKHVAALTFDQIAIALNLNRNTAASRYRDAVAMLKKHLTSTQTRGGGREENANVR